MKFNRMYMPGTIILTVAIAFGINRYYTLSHSVVTSAQVIAFNEKNDAVGFKFTEGDTSYFVKRPHDSKKQTYQIGEQIQIIYPETNPKNAEIYNEKDQYFFPLAMFVLSIISFGLGYLRGRVRNSAAKIAKQ